MSKEMLTALETLEAEKGIAKEIVIEALEAALISAYKRHYGQAQNVEVEFDQKRGDIHVYAVKEVTEEVMDSQLEVSIKDATAINPHYEIGDKIRFEVDDFFVEEIGFDAQTSGGLLFSVAKEHADKVQSLLPCFRVAEIVKKEDVSIIVR